MTARDRGGADGADCAGARGVLRGVVLGAGAARLARRRARGADRCTLDRAIPLALQKAGCDPVIELATDHSPWLSRTDELVAALDRLAVGR